MQSIRMLIAVPDDAYVAPMEKEILEELRHDVELFVVTDMEYLRRFLSSPQSFDVVLWDESIPVDLLEGHAVGHVYVLVGEPQQEQPVNEGRSNVYKYTGPQELYAKTVGAKLNNGRGRSGAVRAGIIMVYAPSGGTGQTTVAAGLCAALAGLQKRVLFIGMDGLQSFGNMLPSSETLKPGAEKVIAGKSEFVLEGVRPYFVNIGFDVLPPLPMAPAALGIYTEQYIHLLENASRSEHYDYIVIDPPADFGPDLAKLMSLCSRIFLLVRQDEQSVNKMQRLLSGIDVSDGERFQIVCNKFEREAHNALQQLEAGGVRIREYVPYDLAMCPWDTGYLGRQANLQTMALHCI